NCARYDPDAWDDAARLPLGVASFGSCVSCLGVVVPCMAQMWWIAETAGNIGCKLTFVVSRLLNLTIRSLERRVSG
ncbi:uncharacterized protein BDZ83DRAFT_587727, partial [Colletotrichum acutatum]